jgi:hypothetical protein
MFFSIVPGGGKSNAGGKRGPMVDRGLRADRRSVAEGAQKGEEKTHQLLMLGTMNFRGFRVKEVTPNEEFYVTSYFAMIPAPDAKSYRLRVEWMVEHPFALSLDELGVRVRHPPVHRQLRDRRGRFRRPLRDQRGFMRWK